MSRNSFDLNVYERGEEQKLAEMLKFITRHMQDKHEGLRLEMDDNFLLNVATHILSNHEKVTRDQILSPAFIHDLKMVVTVGSNSQLDLTPDMRPDKELIEKLSKLLKSESLKDKKLTPEELKLELKKHLTPEEIKKLDSALDALMKDDEFKAIFKNKPPAPANKKPGLSEEDAAVDRLANNLFGLTSMRAGAMPVVVTCFLGNSSSIVRQGPTYETEQTQIALPDRTSDTQFGDSLGLNQEAVDKMATLGLDTDVLDGVVSAVNAQILRPR